MNKANPISMIAAGSALSVIAGVLHRYDNAAAVIIRDALQDTANVMIHAGVGLMEHQRRLACLRGRTYHADPRRPLGWLVLREEELA